MLIIWDYDKRGRLNKLAKYCTNCPSVLNIHYRSQNPLNPLSAPLQIWPGDYYPHFPWVALTSTPNTVICGLTKLLTCVQLLSRNWSRLLRCGGVSALTANPHFSNFVSTDLKKNSLFSCLCLTLSVCCLVMRSGGFIYLLSFFFAERKKKIPPAAAWMR